MKFCYNSLDITGTSWEYLKYIEFDENGKFLNFTYKNGDKKTGCSHISFEGCVKAVTDGTYKIYDEKDEKKYTLKEIEEIIGKVFDEMEDRGELGQAKWNGANAYFGLLLKEFERKEKE